jgi:hypothetical protein
MDLLELLMGGGDPVQRQLAQAEALRSREAVGAALQRSRQDAGQYDLLNFAAQAAGNNPGLAAGVGSLQKAAGARNKVEHLGNTGIIIGDQVVENPAWTESKQEDRKTRLLQAAAMLQSKREQQEAANARAEEGRALRMTLAGMAAGGRNSAAADKAEAAAAKTRETNTMKYSNALTKDGIPEFAEAMDLVKNTLGKYKPGELPGFGRLAGMVPSAMSSSEVQMTRSNMQTAANILLKSRSGAAVTDSEMNRFLQEVASGKGMDEMALRNGWANVERTFGAKAAGLAAGYGDDIHQEYISRGGRDFRKSAQVAPAAQPSDDELINKWLKKK